MAWQERDDNVPGQIYLMKAIGYHGLIPGCYLSRMKIGLSRNPDARLDQLHSNQPPCDLEIVHTIDVNDMAQTEEELHEIFKNSNVKLIKSREYFDLMPWQVQHCICLMNRYKIKRSRDSEINMKGVVGSVIALIGVGILIGQSFQPEPSKTINQTKIEKSIKQNK